MALREIVKFPDARLKKISEPIRDITDEHRELASDLCEVMYGEPGIGLAAPQVGESIRLIVVDTGWTEEGAERQPLVVVNPEILEPEGTVVWNEGCLSVPDYTADVERAERVLLRGLDLDGKPIEERVEGLRAVCFQHEVDHLEGILFIDRISRLKRGIYVKKRKKQLLTDEEEPDSTGTRP